MNDGKIIIDKIIAEAEEVAKASLAKGQKEADAVLKAAQEKVNKELDVFDRNAQAEAEKAAAKEISGAQMQAKKAILETKQEILAETIAEAEKRLLLMKKENPVKVLDMCTGSGCIPISLKLRNPQIVIEGADISEEALKVAEKNAKKLGVSGKWIQTDMFENITGTFDMITSNPPYIPTKVIEELEAEVRLHVPYEALDGKEDGLYFYRILAEKVPEYLTDGGWLVMEIGYDQSTDVEKLLKETGFEQVSTQKDLAGLDRVVCGVYNRRSE